VFHLIRLLLKLLLKIEGEFPDNARLAGGIFIGGMWLLLMPGYFLNSLGSGWIGASGQVGFAWVFLTFMVVRRKIRNWQARAQRAMSP